MTPSIRADLKRAEKFVTQDQCRRFVRRETYARINARRGELIYKGRLTDAEAAELEVLQGEVRRLVDTAHPFKVEAMEEMLNELEEAAASREQTGEQTEAA